MLSFLGLEILKYYIIYIGIALVCYILFFVVLRVINRLQKSREVIRKIVLILHVVLYITFIMGVSLSTVRDSIVVRMYMRHSGDIEAFEPPTRIRFAEYDSGRNNEYALELDGVTYRFPYEAVLDESGEYRSPQIELITDDDLTNVIIYRNDDESIYKTIEMVDPRGKIKDELFTNSSTSDYDFWQKVYGLGYDDFKVGMNKSEMVAYSIGLILRQIDGPQPQYYFEEERFVGFYCDYNPGQDISVKEISIYIKEGKTISLVFFCRSLTEADIICIVRDSFLGK